MECLGVAGNFHSDRTVLSLLRLVEHAHVAGNGIVIELVTASNAASHEELWILTICCSRSDKAPAGVCVVDDVASYTIGLVRFTRGSICEVQF